MRKLWLVAKEQRKNELERLAAGDETAKGRVNVPGALAMETAAIKEGRVRCALLRFRVAEPTRLDSSYHARGPRLSTCLGVGKFIWKRSCASHEQERSRRIRAS